MFIIILNIPLLRRTKGMLLPQSPCATVPQLLGTCA